MKKMLAMAVVVVGVLAGAFGAQARLSANGVRLNGTALTGAASPVLVNGIRLAH